MKKNPRAIKDPTTIYETVRDTVAQHGFATLPLFLAAISGQLSEASDAAVEQAFQGEDFPTDKRHGFAHSGGQLCTAAKLVFEAGREAQDAMSYLDWNVEGV